MARFCIAHNDVCEFYDNIKNDKEEMERIWGYDPDDEDSEPPSDEELWRYAHEEMERCLDDEQLNLDEKLSTRIVCKGTIERWNGRRTIYPEALECNTLGGIIQFCASKFETWHLYDDEGDVYVLAYGHDNPTKPHRIEFRLLTEYGNEMWDSIEYSDNYVPNEELIEKHSEPIGRMIQKVYGYKYERD